MTCPLWPCWTLHACTPRGNSSTRGARTAPTSSTSRLSGEILFQPPSDSGYIQGDPSLCRPSPSWRSVNRGFVAQRVLWPVSYIVNRGFKWWRLGREQRAVGARSVGGASEVLSYKSGAQQRRLGSKSKTRRRNTEIAWDWITDLLLLCCFVGLRIILTRIINAGILRHCWSPQLLLCIDFALAN